MFVIYLLILLSTSQETGKVKGRILPLEGERNWGVYVEITNTDINTST